METQSHTELVADGLQRIKDAAEFLGVSRSLIYRLITEGVLPTVRIGRSRRIPIRAVHELANIILAHIEERELPAKTWLCNGEIRSMLNGTTEPVHAVPFRQRSAII